VCRLQPPAHGRKHNKTDEMKNKETSRNKEKEESNHVNITKENNLQNEDP
jgi:hypothetical protein